MYNKGRKKDFYQVSLKMLLKNDCGEILALNARDDGSYAGFYDLPGGRIHADEFSKPFSEIIKREVREEIGDDITYALNEKPVALSRHLIPAMLTKEGRDIHILCLFFEAKYMSGEINISDEHTGYLWLDFSKIKPEQYFKSGNLDGIKMYLV